METRDLVSCLRTYGFFCKPGPQKAPGNIGKRQEKREGGRGKRDGGAAGDSRGLHCEGSPKTACHYSRVRRNCDLVDCEQEVSEYGFVTIMVI